MDDLHCLFFDGERRGLIPPPKGEGGRPRACPGAAGWGIAQSVINHGQDTLEISIDLVVPEPQCPEPIAGKVSVAGSIPSGMRIEVVLAAVDFNNEPVLETHEVDDMTIARSLSAKMETLFSPGAQIDPQLHLLRGHSLAQTASGFVSHKPPPGRLRRPPSPFGGGIATLLPGRAKSHTITA